MWILVMQNVVGVNAPPQNIMKLQLVCLGWTHLYFGFLEIFHIWLCLSTFLVYCWLVLPTTTIATATNNCLLTMFKTVSYASPSHLALQLFSSGKHSISAKLSIEGSLKVAHLCMCQDHAGPIRPLAGLRGGGPPSGSGEPGCFVLGGPVPVTRSPLDADFPPPASSWPSAFFIHGWHRLLLDPDIRRPEGPGTELGSQPLL